MNIEYERLRYFVIEVLRKNSYNSFHKVTISVESLARTEGLLPPNHNINEENIREIMHDLYIQGIIVFGLNSSNPGWPWFKITEYGKKCLTENEIIPYDPDGYLKKLRESISNIDEVIIAYVIESLQAFLRGCYMASTVMLGCASEKAFILITNAYQNSIKDTKERDNFRRKMEDTHIKTRFDKLNYELNKIKADLPADIAENLETNLNGIFTLIRNYRNDVGHPTGKKIDRETAYANLILFITYCKKAYNLKDYFGEKHI